MILNKKNLKKNPFADFIEKISAADFIEKNSKKLSTADFIKKKSTAIRSFFDSAERKKVDKFS